MASIIRNTSLELDKGRLLNNIKVEAKRKNIAIGQLEEDAGVSVGYLSRQNAEGSRIDLGVIAKIAQTLNVSIDDLVYVDFERPLSVTENKIYAFLKQIVLDTRAESLNWSLFPKEVLRKVQGVQRSPFHGGDECILYNYEYDETGNNPEYTFKHQLFVSRAATSYVAYYINGPAYYASIAGDAKLFITQVRYIARDPADKDNPCTGFKYLEGTEADQKFGLSNVELFLASSDSFESLCNKHKVSELLAKKIDELLKEAKASTERVQLSAFTKGVIDNYLNPPAAFGTFGSTDGDIPF